MLSSPNPVAPLTSLFPAGQTFQRATQLQTLELCPNQGWSRHRPNKLANIRQNPAYPQLNIRRSHSVCGFSRMPLARGSPQLRPLPSRPRARQSAPASQHLTCLFNPVHRGFGRRSSRKDKTAPCGLSLCSLELGRADVPVRPAFHGDGAQILTEIFHGWLTEEPVAVVDLVDN